MRYKLNNPKLFFDELLAEQKINLKQLSKKLDLSYTLFKQCRRGDLTLSGYYFDKLIELSPRKTFWKENCHILDDYWGRIKGGTVTGNKLDIKNRLIYARKFRKLKEVKFELDATFCEFYGILLGDGCISRFKNERGIDRFQIVISCNMKLESEYLKSLRDILIKKYGLNPYYYEQKEINSCRLTINNKKFCLDLNKMLDVPIGVKYDKIHISKKILALPWDKKKYVLRGLFDTDGIIFARKDENYRYPHISITSKSLSFLNQIKGMLRSQNYPAYINGVDVRIKGIENIKKWFNDIGSSNSRNLKKYNYFLNHGIIPPQSMGLW